MAFTAMNASATGLNALSTSLEVIANNLANTNTDGFKSSRVNLQDLLYSRGWKMTSETSPPPDSTSVSVHGFQALSSTSSRERPSTPDNRSM